MSLKELTRLVDYKQRETEIPPTLVLFCTWRSHRAWNMANFIPVLHKNPSNTPRPLPKKNVKEKKRKLNKRCLRKLLLSLFGTSLATILVLVLELLYWEYRDIVKYCLHASFLHASTTHYAIYTTQKLMLSSL
jgi:hypothetical protein